MTNMIAAERLYLTADAKRLVREGDPDGASLYVAPGDEILPSAVERFGLVDGTLPAKVGKPTSGDKSGGGTKEKQPGSDKEKKPDGDKGAGGGAASGADDLTKIKFVGAKVAAGFASAGLTTFAQIAAIDVSAPPAVEGTNATTKWSEIVESAKALIGPATPAEDQGNGTAADSATETGAADQGAS